MPKDCLAEQQEELQEAGKGKGVKVLTKDHDQIIKAKLIKSFNRRREWQTAISNTVNTTYFFFIFSKLKTHRNTNNLLHYVPYSYGLTKSDLSLC